MRARTSIPIFVLFLALCAPAARAADDLDLNAQRFRPSPHAYDFLTTMSSRVGDTWDWHVDLLLNWSADSLAFEDAAGRDDDLVTGRLTADVMASVSFWKYLSVGLRFPLHLYTGTGDPNAAFSPNTGGPIDRGSIEGFGWGDLTLSPKVRIFDAHESKVGLALAFDLGLPTGKADAFATDGGVTFAARLIADLDIEGWRAALNVGYRYRPDFDLRWLHVGQEFELGFAFEAPIIKDNLAAIAELEAGTKLETFFDDNNNDYLEGRLALRYTSDAGLGVTVGGGAAFLQSYGDPLYRVFAGIAYTPRYVERDRDHDGIEDEVDGCPDAPEDKDDFEDADGCPDPDNDADGVLDVSDRCPGDPEDKDGFEDADGCPDPDNDKDGILDLADGCPNDPEDKDGFEDADGCPDPDNDKDGLLDASDQCPNEAETRNGCKDEDGCPEEGKVCLTETKIEILEMVYFDTAKATIKPESFPVLDEVVAVLKAHPEIRKLRVEGHTDDRGRPASNLKLSKARAKAVMTYLVKAGVDPKRLVSEGYGQTKPIAANETPEGRSKNRRVEFVILEKADK